MTTATHPNETSTATSQIVLVGNPNVGKSVMFKNLTSRYVVVANYPGTTVELIKARANFNGQTREVIDTPGLNDLEQNSDDARATSDLLRDGADTTIVQVADAKNLRRALLLTLQLAEKRQPMVLALNMADELEERGGRIDTERLSEILGIPVVVTVAPENRGTGELIEAIDNARVPTGVWLQMNAEERLGVNRARLAKVNEVLSETYTLDPPKRASFGVKLGFWAMHPVFGIGFLGIVLLAVFWFVGLFGAGSMVDLMEVGLFQHHVNPITINAVDAVLPFEHEHIRETVDVTVGLPTTPVTEWEVGRLSREVITPEYTLDPGTELGPLAAFNRFVHDFLVGEFGMITMALSYGFAIVLPIVTAFFIVFSILEDSGYFPRMAIMLNRVFRFMGLNGKAVLPMILGLGCDTMATMTTRILETRRERLVTTLLLALAVPCSAQLGVLLALMAALAPASSIVWVGVVVGIILMVGWLTKKLFNGHASEFVLEIPPMRKPQLSNVMIKTVSRLNWYLREVIPLFVLGTAILFLLDKLKLLGGIARALEPLVVNWLGLPADMANAFLIGFLRRDFGAVYILDASSGPNPALSSHQILVAMITLTLFIPCVAHLLVITKEHGRKVALQMAAFIFPFAFLVGGLVNHIGRWLFNI